MTEPIVFGCEDGFQALLGSFDGRDRRTLMTHAFTQRPEQLLVSIHEQLHEELHWSTAWGLTSAMAGLLAHASVRPDDLTQTAEAMNAACRQVHERFATTISSGALGVHTAQELMAGNSLYLSYLDDGLTLGGPVSRWPWQFRESAIQMLLRTLMQTAELSTVAEAGFSRLLPSDIAAQSMHPDVRWAAVREQAAGWWTGTFAEVLDAHPDRGGDTGGSWERELPEDLEAMERMKAWEETVLIPALGETARRHLAAAGFAVLAQDEYLDVVATLRRSFLELAPDDWDVEVFTERRRLGEEMLGGEREALKLADVPAELALCDADDLPARAAEFLLDGPDGRHVLSVLLDRAALERAGTAARTAGEQDGRRRGATRWALVKAQPLRPGQLNDLVLAYVQNADEPVGPVAVARALGRSSGAVANCLDRLTRAGDLRQVADRPRRYAKA